MNKKEVLEQTNEQMKCNIDDFTKKDILAVFMIGVKGGQLDMMYPNGYFQSPEQLIKMLEAVVTGLKDNMKRIES